MAEMGLRQAAADALVTLGNSQDRDKLWEYAKSGDIGRGSERIDTLFHLNMLHVLGRTPKTGELAKFQDAAEAQPERFKREILPLVGYYIAGEQCDSLECWAGILESADEVVAHEAAQAAINFEAESDDDAEEPAEGADAAEEQGVPDEMKAAREDSVRSAAQTAAVWTLILEYGDQPAAQEALAGALTHDREVIKNLIPTAMLVLPSVTDSAKETIEDKLEQLGIGAQAIGTSDYAQMLHVIVLTR
jgi:hypothetical protein